MFGNVSSLGDSHEHATEEFCRVLRSNAVMIGWSVTIDRVGAQQESFIGGFDPAEWKVGHQVKDQEQIVIEFVRPEEKIDCGSQIFGAAHFDELPERRR